MTALGDFFPKRVNMWFSGAKYAADVGADGFGKIRIPALPTLDADGILDGVSIASAVDTSSFAATYEDDNMGKFGRNVTVVSDGAATSAVTVYGYDYLGQPMMETFALNGTSPVLGVKAFARVTRVTAAVTASRTLDVGWGNKLGLPYKLIDVITVLKNNAEPADADTPVVGSVATQSATSADPRGTLNLHSNNVTNNTNYYDVFGLWDTSNLYGVQHYFA